MNERDESKMSDIKIPHDRLPALRRMLDGSIIPADLDVVREFIAAAEADQPPLPEDWVVERHPDGASRIVWHKDGVTSMWSNGNGETITGYDSRLTPLRPTVTEADVEKAAEAVERLALDLTYTDLVRALFEAAGIEVRP